MKRRAFLTTVGSAAGAAALGGCCSTPKQCNGTSTTGGTKHGRLTSTYALSSVTPADPNSPFALSVRQPGWFPDGADIGGQPKRLFQEEVVGIKQNEVVESFPVEFGAGPSNKWILGSPISASQGKFTTFVRKVAVKIRQYNASLYRLRRLHFYYDYRNTDPRLVKFPKPNPHGDPKDANGTPIVPSPKSDPQQFKAMVKAAEDDWVRVADRVNQLLETASSETNAFGFQLLAADMIAANGYIVSMRVVVKKPGANPTPGPHPPETGGSSSHVSISSVFSSSSQN